MQQQTHKQTAKEDIISGHRSRRQSPTGLKTQLGRGQASATGILRTPTPIKRTRKRGSRDVKNTYVKTEAENKLPLLTDADEAKAKELADEGMFESHSQRYWCFEHPLLSN